MWSFIFVLICSVVPCKLPDHLLSLFRKHIFPIFTFFFLNGLTRAWEEDGQIYTVTAQFKNSCPTFDVLHLANFLVSDFSLGIETFSMRRAFNWKAPRPRAKHVDSCTCIERIRNE